jgi:hypothetical protein
MSEPAGLSIKIAQIGAILGSAFAAGTSNLPIIRQQQQWPL